MSNGYEFFSQHTVYFQCYCEFAIKFIDALCTDAILPIGARDNSCKTLIPAFTDGFAGILQCRYIPSQTFQFRVVPKNPNRRIWMVLDSPSLEKVKAVSGHLLISGSSPYNLIFQDPLLPEIPALEMSTVSSHAGGIPGYSMWQFIKQPD
ncbi:hypothetical protein B0H13DRAFT_1898991 [Mycena leptocephala]|nr:hypothetical protein B0H13DRAFT_1898991 [Mycena leptocephala]